MRVLEAQFGADATVDALRATAAGVRRAIADGERLDADAVVTRVESDAAARLGETFRPSLAPVVNATGVIIHTNLGRAPLAAEIRVEDHARRVDDRDRKSTRLNSSHSQISYAVFCLKKKTTDDIDRRWLTDPP